MKQKINKALNIIVSILAGIAIAVLFVFKGIVKFANVLTLAGVITIISMLCRG